MTLNEWLDETKTTEKAFAEAIGKTQQSVNRYRNGLQFPDLRTMAKITELTCGAVRTEDFFGKPVETPPSDAADAA